MEHQWNYSARSETQITLHKNCFSAILATTNPTWTGLVLKMGLHNENRVTASAILQYMLKNINVKRSSHI